MWEGGRREEKRRQFLSKGGRENGTLYFEFDYFSVNIVGWLDIYLMFDRSLDELKYTSFNSEGSSTPTTSETTSPYRTSASGAAPNPS